MARRLFHLGAATASLVLQSDVLSPSSLLFDGIFDLDVFVFVMAPPAMLQKYLNRITRDGQPYRTTDRAWEKIMVAKDRTLARDIERAPNRTVLDGKLIERIEITMLGKSGPNRGHKNLSTPPAPRGKGSGKGTGKGKPRGVPDLANLVIAEDAFLSDGADEPLIRFEPDQLDEDAQGYFCCSGQQAADILELRMRMDPIASACVLVVKQAAMDATRSVNVRRLKGYFDPIRIKPLWKDETGEKWRLSASFST